MKRTKQERRAAALERLKETEFRYSRANRTGSQTKEEWQICKDAEIAHLEELINGRKTP